MPKVVEVLETLINHFDPSEELSSLSSGAAAPKDVEGESVGAKKNRRECSNGIYKRSHNFKEN